MEETKEYIGTWVTADGYIRHELLPGNRYDEARGKRKSACQGNYLVTGNHIDYRDDTGFTADGEFRDNVLYHAGMVLHKSILTILLFAVSLQLSAQTSSETRNAQAIRKLYEAVNTKDLNYIKSLGDEKSEWLDVPFNITSKGENAIIDPWKSWFDIFPDKFATRIGHFSNHFLGDGNQVDVLPERAAGTAVQVVNHKTILTIANLERLWFGGLGEGTVGSDCGLEFLQPPVTVHINENGEPHQPAAEAT